jgi:acyl-CoA thioesterase FadM
VHFRAAIVAGELITVETGLAGHVQGALVFKHRVLSGDRVCATATTVRSLLP